MSFNELLTEAGDFGLYQKMCIGFLWASITIAVLTYWTNVFVLLVAPHRCRLSPNDTWENNMSLDQGIIVRECDISFNASWRETFFEAEGNSHHSHLVGQPENSTWTTIPCPHGWVYDFSTFYPTISTEVTLLPIHLYIASVFVLVFNEMLLGLCLLGICIFTYI